MPTVNQKYHPRRIPKQRYQLRNWSAYNESLKQRGSLEIWLSPQAQASWYAAPTGTPGSPSIYSDVAITCCLSIRKLFRLPYRQTQGFIRSVFHQTNVTLTAPDYTTLSRRSRHLLVKLPTNKRKKKVRLIVDSSSAKVVGEGEWKTTTHGPQYHTKWKKIHVVIDEDGEVRASEVTEDDVADASVTESLLDQEHSQIISFTGDGAYDKRLVYAALHERSIPRIVIPPRRNARIWRHGNRAGPQHPRDENLRHIRKCGRTQWARDRHYHRRSLVETTISRYKTIFGERVLAREAARQRTELTLGFSMLNTMMQLGMPDSYARTG